MAYGFYGLFHAITTKRTNKPQKRVTKEKYMYDTTMWMAESVEDVCFSVAHCFVVCITENVSCIEGMLLIRFSRRFHANVLLVSNEKLCVGSLNERGDSCAECCINSLHE